MPEKSLNEIPRALREQYEKGVAAFQRQNYDYAITFFSQVLLKEPGFYDCRQALRATQFKKTGGTSSFFKKMIGGVNPMLGKGQLALRKNPLEALQIAEQILNGDPNSNSAHKLMADAALAADLPRTAILSLEIVAKNSPDDADTSLELAEAYSRVGQIDKAEAIYNELAQTRANDPKFSEILKNFHAHKTMAEGGYNNLAGGQGSYRDILKDKQEAVALEQENRQFKDEDVSEKLLREYQERLLAEPGNSRLMRNIAELYTQRGEFDRAIEFYQRITSMEGGNDPSLQKAITSVELKKLDAIMSELNPDSPDYGQQVEELKRQRETFMLEECKKRVDQYPNDLQLRFELGEQYFKAGRIGEAIQEFQKTQSNPHRRVQSLSYLGRCFAARNMFDLAARTLQNALKEKLAFDDEKKELIYSLGAVLEKMGKRDEAIEQFKQIYEVDIGYKDVAAKVDAFYAAG